MQPPRGNTVQKRQAVLLIIASLLLSGCVQQKSSYQNPYEQVIPPESNKTLNESGSNQTNVTIISEPVPIDTLPQKAKSKIFKFLEWPVVNQIYQFLDGIVKDLFGIDGWLWLGAILVIGFIIKIAADSFGLALLFIILAYVVRHFIFK